MAHLKPDLPEKLCPVCRRPFKWRKKWQKSWEQVKYCSDKCRKKRNPKATGEDARSASLDGTD